jgi:hypothetical protein
MTNGETTAIVILTAVLFIWNLFEASVLESPYPKELLQLYSFPLWRLVLVLLVVVATYWSPRLGIFVALAVFFYLEDLQKLLTSWTPFRVRNE